ncbi:excinuclease ABC A subunit [Saccharothrix ecbatanensis]|uniref:UvrABC system protein A n=1 Tax=Saccharothrix ecbatanensis TaxID=1105145 RepID=A0A7W9HHP2_9PSEU|nr:excinuclease ABC subunit UvrA [Saccharothrix ecbatanensis]MBB5802231.1 excinuclease ABC A subunit [Saccharothrix ecbatanensis]
MSDSIEIRGARENNLMDVSLDIPKKKLTVFTGVSGSGKSSLVFATLAAESQRLLNETFTAFIQSVLPQYGRPDVDALSGLSAAIVVDQKRLGGDARSTVGTATDAYSVLRILFARLGRPHVGSASMFSFNDQQGMCSACGGLGQTSHIDLDQLLDRDLALADGAIRFPTFAVESWFWTIIVKSEFFDVHKKLRDYTDDEMGKLLHTDEVKIRNGQINSTYEGLIPKFTRLYLTKDPDSMAPHLRVAVERVVTTVVCETCAGSRLSAETLSCKIAGTNIAECAAMQVSELAEFVDKISDPTVAPVVAALRVTLDNLNRIGLGYLSLDRRTSTLSGGESQRVKMVRHLGSSLTDVTYIFDEPTVGLHPHDITRLNELLLQLRDKGNTVLVVEHKPDVIAVADHVVDLGPGAGKHGGRIMYQGDVAGLRASDTITGRHLADGALIKTTPRTPTGALRVEHANLHNLKDVTVDIPLGVLTAVTGVAGAGKSTLITGALPRQHPDVVVIDQDLPRANRRSNPATYTGILDPIRKAFAKANRVNAALFSPNSAGACPQCKGLGLIYTDLAFLDTMVSVCDACDGRRFTDEVLTYTLRGQTINDVFGMTAELAVEFFTERTIAPTLNALVDVGLGYLTLGQPLSTLSGGERQRLKLAIEIINSGQVYVLDEPTSGLHMHDVDNLIGLLDRLVDLGRTVIVIEHNVNLIASADHVIDLGPGAGHLGGTVVYQGGPAGLAEDGNSLTGHHLRRRANVPAGV